jgi:hypothetical protein
MQYTLLPPPSPGLPSALQQGLLAHICLEAVSVAPPDNAPPSLPGTLLILGLTSVSFSSGLTACSPPAVKVRLGDSVPCVSCSWLICCLTKSMNWARSVATPAQGAAAAGAAAVRYTKMAQYRTAREKQVLIYRWQLCVWCSVGN